MNDILIPFTNYDRLLYNFNICGDLLVFGLSLIECQNNLEVSKEHLKNVLKFMIKRHPYLRAQIKFDDLISFKIAIDYSQVNINEEDILIIKLKSRDELKSKLEDATKMKINFKDKLWRLIAFEFKEKEQHIYGISFWLPLFITDALNITTLSIEIINILNSLMNGTVCKEMTEELTSIYNMMDISQRYNLIGEEQLKKIEEINSIQTSSFKFNSLFKNDKERGCGINFFNLDKDVSQKLISLSKKNEVKFTAFIMNCFNYSIRELYHEYCLQDPVNVKFGLSANLRIRVNPLIDFSNMGYFSCLIPINTVYPKFGKYEYFWEEAKYLDELILENTNVKTGAIFNEFHNYKVTNEIVNLFDEIGNVEKFSSILSSESKWDVVISNVGTHLTKHKSQNSKEPFTIKELYFSDTQNSYPSIDSAVLIHLVTWNDQLMFMISNNKAGISSAYVERLLILFKSFLLNLIA